MSLSEDVTNPEHLLLHIPKQVIFKDGSEVKIIEKPLLFKANAKANPTQHHPLLRGTWKSLGVEPLPKHV